MTAPIDHYRRGARRELERCACSAELHADSCEPGAFRVAVERLGSLVLWFRGAQEECAS